MMIPPREEGEVTLTPGNDRGYRQATVAPGTPEYRGWDQGTVLKHLHVPQA